MESSSGSSPTKIPMTLAFARLVIFSWITYRKHVWHGKWVTALFKIKGRSVVPVVVIAFILIAQLLRRLKQSHALYN